MSASHQDISSLWAIQDALLSSYYQTFATISSIFFAAYVFAFSHIVLNFSLTMGISGLVLSAIGLISSYFWITTCYHRGRMVNYFQWLLLKHEAGHVIANPYANSLRQRVEIGSRLLTSDHIWLETFLDSEERRKLFPWSPTRMKILSFPIFLFVIYVAGMFYLFSIDWDLLR